MRRPRLLVVVLAVLVAPLAGCLVGLPDGELPGFGEASTPQDDCAMECQGCCDDEGTCRPGTSRDQCGWGGSACNACGENQPCEQAAGGGECAACSPFNCEGCCTSDGACVAGTADDACGRDANQCVACDGFCELDAIAGGTCR